MEPEAVFATLQAKLLGRAVNFRRLAANSLLLYVDCEPGDQTGVIVWFEPTWHVLGPVGVLAGSRQAQFDDAAAEEDGLAQLGAQLDVVLGQTITSLEIDPLTHDLAMTLKRGYAVKTFVSDATDEETWHIRDNATGVILYGSPRGLSVHNRRAEQTDEPERAQPS